MEGVDGISKKGFAAISIACFSTQKTHFTKLYTFYYVLIGLEAFPDTLYTFADITDSPRLSYLPQAHFFGEKNVSWTFLVNIVRTGSCPLVEIARDPVDSTALETIFNVLMFYSTLGPCPLGRPIWARAQNGP